MFKQGDRVRSWGCDIIGTVELAWDTACSVEWDYMRQPRPGVWKGREYCFNNRLSLVPPEQDRYLFPPKAKYYQPNPKSPKFD